MLASLIEKPYLSDAERAAAEGSGQAAFITLLMTMLFNVVIMVLSSGSLEIMWTLLNVL